MIYGYTNKEYDKTSLTDVMKIEHWIVDEGVTPQKRTRYGKLLNRVKAGDTLIVPSISHICIKSKEFVVLYTSLCDKGVRFMSILEDIDSSTENGKYLYKVMCGMKNLQADCKGFYDIGGRPKIDADEETWEKFYPMWAVGDITARAFMNHLGMKPMTFYRRVKEYEEAHGIKREKDLE